ncbi:hypothetical protein NKI30_24725 [Mesorhizobium opportunistum]|uniref:hypothetical protein n=1 Tax=Mesorhizobium opportunistum TaxID=593909 RepID=UPI00333D29EE
MFQPGRTPLHIQIADNDGEAMVREGRVEHVFRYGMFSRCVAVLSSGAIDVKPFITRTFEYSKTVFRIENAAFAPKGEMKMQIALPQ